MVVLFYFFIFFYTFFSLVLSIITAIITNWRTQSDRWPLRCQCKFLSPHRFTTYSLLLCTPVNKKCDWCENKERGSAGPIRKESLFGVQNRALEAQLLPGYTDCRQLQSQITVGRKQVILSMEHKFVHVCGCVGERVSDGACDCTCARHSGLSISVDL